MYYQPFDAACAPKTWNISDDLGQIEYVFSDKTGTLTQNIMEFQKCSVNGVPYGEGITDSTVTGQRVKAAVLAGLALLSLAGTVWGVRAVNRHTR